MPIILMGSYLQHICCKLMLFLVQFKDGEWHNPIAPPSASNVEDGEITTCDFFKKTGACKYDQRLVHTKQC